MEILEKNVYHCLSHGWWPLATWFNLNLPLVSTKTRKVPQLNVKFEPVVCINSDSKSNRYENLAEAPELNVLAYNKFFGQATKGN